MFHWPLFARHLADGRLPGDRLGALMDALAQTSSSESHPQELFVSLFGSGELTAELCRETIGFHHVGVIAPAGLDVPAVDAVLAGSAFRHRRLTFPSAILTKDMSARLQRPVELTVVMGHAAGPACWPAVEVFVSNLAAAELDPVIDGEVGCHVAVELGPDGSFERVANLLRRHGCQEIPLMQQGPLTNHAIRSRLLYFDVCRGGRMRRLEFIAPTSR